MRRIEPSGQLRGKAKSGLRPGALPWSMSGPAGVGALRWRARECFRPTQREAPVKKSPPSHQDVNEATAAPVKRGRGRPPSDKPPTPGAQRQAAYRERLRQTQGRRSVSLMLQDQVIVLLDELRGDETREAFIERLLAASARRSRRP